MIMVILTSPITKELQLYQLIAPLYFILQHTWIIELDNSECQGRGGRVGQAYP